MKMYLRIGALALSCFLFSCQKENSETEGPGSGGGGNDYQPTTAGSEWNYKSTLAGNYKLTALGTDSLINGEKYYKFDNTWGGRQYMNKNNGVYSSYATSLEGDKKIIATYLKDAPIGTTWSQTYNNQGTISTYTYKVVNRDGNKTIDGKNYSNVITVEYEGHVQNPMGGGSLKFATGRSYAAKGIGGIASSYKLDLMGFTMEDSTYLTSYTIK